MDAETSSALLAALRHTQLFAPEQLRDAAHAAAGADGDAAAFAERLFALGLITDYQFRKLRGGKSADVLFGAYVILDKIGEGGMGKVFRAVEAGGRVVALKTIRPHLMSNATVLKRYQREARAVAALDHPNVVKLYDADVCGGRFYMAMEYVDGIDLSKIVKQFGAPPHRGLDDIGEVCEYARQAALGLQAAHDGGFVHRDIKPSNLLVFGERALSGTGGRAVVKILDMGLVRCTLDGDDISATDLTRDGTVVGTPDYMAPEQAKNSSTVDHRADLYALGATLYYLLKGQPPFPEGSPIDKLIRHQLDEPPPLRHARPDLPATLCELVERLMRKNPDDRPRTAREVAAALERLRDGAPAGDPAGIAFLPVSLEPESPPSASSGALASDGVPVPEGSTVVLGVAAPAPVDPAAVTPGAGLAPPLRSAPTPPNGAPKRRPEAAATAPRPAPRSGDARRAGPAASAAPRAPRVIDAEVVRMPAPPRPEPHAPPSSGRLRRPAPPPAKPKKRESRTGWLLAGAAVAVAVALAALLLQNRADEEAPPTAPENKGAPPAPAPPVARSAVLPSQLLPGDAVAAAVLHPSPLWKRAAFDWRAGTPVGDFLQRLNQRTKFDARAAERLVAVWVRGGATPAVAGEGGGLAPEQLAPLPDAAWPALPAPRSSGRPARAFRFERALDGPSPRMGAILDGRYYVLADDAAPLTELARRIGAGPLPLKRPADDLCDALDAAAKPNAPLLTFAAGPDFALADDGETLAQGRVRFLGFTLALREQAEVTVRVVAEDRAKFKEFVSRVVAQELGERYRPFRKLIDQFVRQAEATPLEPVPAGRELNLTMAVPVPELLAALTKLAGPVNGGN